MQNHGGQCDHITFQEMMKQKYNLDDLMVQLREKGYRSVEEIEYAILENNGTLSVFSYPSLAILVLCRHMFYHLY